MTLSPQCEHLARALVRRLASATSVRLLGPGSDAHLQPWEVAALDQATAAMEHGGNRHVERLGDLPVWLLSYGGSVQAHRSLGTAARALAQLRGEP